jgi:hypothetical protein
MLKEDTDMAGKKAVNKSKGQPQFPIGTRHSYAPTLTTLIRTPVPLPFDGKDKAPAEAKREFIHGLLKAAGAKGITWPAMQQALTAKYCPLPLGQNEKRQVTCIHAKSKGPPRGLFYVKE